MQAKINELRESFKTALGAAVDAAALENVRIDFLGKKGHIAELMKGLRDVADKKAAGQLINGLKCEVEEALAELLKRSERLRLRRRSEARRSITRPLSRLARWALTTP